MSGERRPATRAHRLACGCEIEVGQVGWTLCLRHKIEHHVTEKLEAAMGVPQCPEHCGDARRPKCMWENPGCPRRPVLDAWNQLVRAGTALQMAYLDAGLTEPWDYDDR